MTEQVQGLIQDIFTKQVTIKRGPKAGNTSTVYEAVLDTGHKVNLGFKCDYTKGESVNWALEATNFGDYKLLIAGQASASPAKQPTTSSTPPAPPVPRKEFPIDKSSRGMSITRQNSGGHAATMVAALINAGEIKSSTVAMEVWLEMVYDITDFATGHREEAQAKAMQVLED